VDLNPQRGDPGIPKVGTRKGINMTTPDHERMSRVDTAWLRMDRPGNSMMIVSVTATETPISYEDFKTTIERRFLCFPRFRHRPVQDAFGASWVEDQNFELDAHLKRSRLPRGGSQKKHLETLAAQLAGEPLDPARPMWQVHLVEDYLGGSAWVMRIHHCYADGIAMTHVLLSMAEQDPAPAMASRSATPNSAPQRSPIDLIPILDWVQHASQPAGDILENLLTGGMKLMESGVHRTFHPQQTAALAAQAGRMAAEFAKVVSLPDDPDTPLRGEMDGSKRIAWAEPIPLPEVKTIGKAVGCTVNDVIMSTVAGALGSYLRSIGFDPDAVTVRASVPVNLRAAEEPLTLGNKFGLIFVPMPIGVRNPLERLAVMHGTMRSLKGSMQPPMTLQVLGLMGMLPAAVQSSSVDLLSRKSSLVLSNVPGPQAPLFVCGQRVSEMYFWVPQSGSIGVGVSVLSYAGKVFFGMISGTHPVPDPHAIASRFGGEFEKLLLGVMVGALAAKDQIVATDPGSSGRGTKRPRRRRPSK
jgi:diacylglycerol O-acyltransferase